VIDEIEAGRAIMDAHSPPEAKVETPEAGGTPKNARTRLNEYYAKQRAKASASAASDDPGDRVGKCKLATGIQFTRRSDCMLRGGTFL
jgi:hypothetical protein